MVIEIPAAVAALAADSKAGPPYCLLLQAAATARRLHSLGSVPATVALGRTWLTRTAAEAGIRHFAARWPVEGC